MEAQALVRCNPIQLDCTNSLPQKMMIEINSGPYVLRFAVVVHIAVSYSNLLGTGLLQHKIIVSSSIVVHL